VDRHLGDWPLPLKLFDLRATAIRVKADADIQEFRWNDRGKEWRDTVIYKPTVYDVRREGLHSRCSVEVRPVGFGLPIWLEWAGDRS
jgi:hypothetical protein